jgi:hypothetical protein
VSVLGSEDHIVIVALNPDYWQLDADFRRYVVHPLSAPRTHAFSITIQLPGLDLLQSGRLISLNGGPGELTYKGNIPEFTGVVTGGAEVFLLAKPKSGAAEADAASLVWTYHDSLLAHLARLRDYAREAFPLALSGDLDDSAHDPFPRGGTSALQALVRELAAGTIPQNDRDRLLATVMGSLEEVKRLRQLAACFPAREQHTSYVQELSWTETLMDAFLLPLLRGGAIGDTPPPTKDRMWWDVWLSCGVCHLEERLPSRQEEPEGLLSLAFGNFSEGHYRAAWQALAEAERLAELAPSKDITVRLLRARLRLIALVGEPHHGCALILKAAEADVQASSACTDFFRFLAMTSRHGLLREVVAQAPVQNSLMAADTWAIVWASAITAQDTETRRLSEEFLCSKYGTSPHFMAVQNYRSEERVEGMRPNEKNELNEIAEVETVRLSAVHGVLRLHRTHQKENKR